MKHSDGPPVKAKRSSKLHGRPNKYKK